MGMLAEKTLRAAGLLMLLASMSLAAELAPETIRAPRSGKQIYNEFCVSCHGGGWQGAPVANDKNEWQSRVEKGANVMLKNAKDGLNAMPPLGTCMDCSDAELSAAIKEMLDF